MAETKKPFLPEWEEHQTEAELELAYERALHAFEERKEKFRGLEKGTIVLVDGNGETTIGKPGEDIVAVSERHYRAYRSPFEGLFEFRIE